MSINSVGANPAIYQPVSSPATKLRQTETTAAKAAPSQTGHDPDHDGDTDGPGLDVNG